MSPKKTDELLRKYPKVFSNSPEIYRYGFSHGDGWYDLIDDLCRELSKLDLPKDFRVQQIKEKFGGLRFYVAPETDEVRELISRFERLSYEVCEACGEPGEERKTKWIRTLCDYHYDLIINDRKRFMEELYGKID